MDYSKLTYGEKVVRTNFNATGDPNITRIKNSIAELINNILSIPSPKQLAQKGPVLTKEESEALDYQQYQWDNYMREAVKYLDLASIMAVKAVTS